MDMPKPNENHEKLHRMIGTWVGDETLYPSPFGPGGRAVGRFDMRAAVDGLFVVQDYAQERDGQVNYRGHGVLGWDDQQKCFIWYWVDSIGFIPTAPSRGPWHGDTLTFESPPMGDGRGRYVYRLDVDGSLYFSLQNSRDAGQTWTTLMDGRYRRV